MHFHVLRLFAVALFAGLLALASKPVFAQEKSDDQDFATCQAALEKADASIDACTRLVDRENRASSSRQAIAITFRGFAWKTKGDLQRAFADFSEAINLDSHFALPFEARGDILRANNQCEEAIADYDRAIKLAPERAPVYISRSLCLIDRKDLDRAVADLDQAIKIDADNKAGMAVMAMNIEARLNVGKGDFERAVASLDEAINLDPRQPAVYIDRGNVWAAKGDDDKALADYDQAIKLDAGNAGGASALLAWISKASLHARKGDLDGAIADYDEAARIDPQRAVLYLDRAALWVKKGDNERARADYDKAIEINPTNAALYNSRGDFYRSTNDVDRAVKDYDRAIEQQADFLPAYGNRALARFNAGEFSKAADDFKRVADTQVNAYPALLLYLSKARDGDAREAKSDLAKTAGKLKPGDWPLPIVELYLGRKSVQAVEGAAKTTDQRCEAQFYIGEWHLLRKDRTEATRALLAAVDSCPKDFVEYRAAVEELKRVK
jgi:tetratricopeptide (TPR) repeat protein